MQFFYLIFWSGILRTFYCGLTCKSKQSLHIVEHTHKIASKSAPPFKRNLITNTDGEISMILIRQKSAQCVKRSFHIKNLVSRKTHRGLTTLTSLLIRLIRFYKLY